MTSFALLIVFSIVHVAAWRLRAKLRLHPVVPVVGTALNAAVVALQISEWL
jgi:hypothetical protein